MPKIIINGQFANRRTTGQERFAHEILLELDKLILGQNLDLEIVVPMDATSIPPLKNIPIIKYGKAYGSLWEQTFFALYTIRHKGVSLNLCSVMPILKPGIICIHDLSYKINSEWFNTPYARISQLWHKIQYHLAWKYSPLIFTVSEYSKKQMIDIYHVDAKRIKVIGNGWEHIKRINIETSITKRYLKWLEKPFFFSLGSLAPNKNIEWILKVAKKHKQYNFLIAGNTNIKSYGTDYKECDYSNVHFLGYISDEEVKFLMIKCHAFIFPSFFEGFGIPPLEALSLGTSIIVSNTSCLPEIFENSAYYIDPYDTNIELDELLNQSCEPSEKILQKCSYKRYARILLSEILKM